MTITYCIVQSDNTLENSNISFGEQTFLCTNRDVQTK